MVRSMKKTIVISLGGSLIVPDGGIDIAFLRKFRALIFAHVRRGVRFVIITGGGTVCRDYQNAIRALGNGSTEDLDWIGIRVSRLNAHLVRIMFGARAPQRFITDPTTIHPGAYKKYPLLIAGGEKPGQSTDVVAVKLALLFDAQEIINLSNIRYVYDRDPRKHKDAKPYNRMSWNELKKIVGSRWTPGANTPFDPRATSLAAKNKRTLFFLHGGDLKNLAQCLAGKKFDGTIVQ